MKVSAITVNKIDSYYSKSHQNADFGKYPLASSLYSIHDLKGVPYYYPVNFTSIGNSSKLRKLFSYGLPCMYSGVDMIDPKVIAKLLKNNSFLKPSGEVIPVLNQFRDSIVEMEDKVFDIIKDRAIIHPELSVQELIQGVEPIYKRRLRKKQAPIFRQLIEVAHDLPETHRYKFKSLMDETDKKLNERPIIIPFSSYEFKYKLSKIRQDIEAGENIKSKKVMAKLMKETAHFTSSTNPKTIENQKKVLSFLERILNTSVLKENDSLRTLIDTSKSRLNYEKIIMQFSRKSFLYDLNSIISDISDKHLKEELMSIATQLPTSQENISAYILKIASEPSDKICHRLLWPSMATVEHILPHSCGGPDIMANFGGACARENSARKSIPFVIQMKLRPDTSQYCQKYIDRLISLYKRGVFAKNGISYNYITDFKNTIYNQSNHLIDLDLHSAA